MTAWNAPPIALFAWQRMIPPIEQTWGGETYIDYGLSPVGTGTYVINVGRDAAASVLAYGDHVNEVCPDLAGSFPYFGVPSDNRADFIWVTGPGVLVTVIQAITTNAHEITPLMRPAWTLQAGQSFVLGDAKRRYHHWVYTRRVNKQGWIQASRRYVVDPDRLDQLRLFFLWCHGYKAIVSTSGAVSQALTPRGVYDPARIRVEGVAGPVAPGHLLLTLTLAGDQVEWDGQDILPMTLAHNNGDPWLARDAAWSFWRSKHVIGLQGGGDIG